MTAAPKTNPTSFPDKLSVFLATGLFISYLPSAVIHSLKNKKNSQTLIEKKWTGAGLFGSFEGALTYLFLPVSIATAWWALLVGFAVSVYFSGRAEIVMGSHDDSRIVIDEWIGAWIALWGLQQHLSIAVLIAFGLFRIIDVFKGPLIRKMQNWPGGMGITMDDVVAGVIANLITKLLISFSPLHLH
jgi:phosphatidylglycerophosphatase A